MKINSSGLLWDVPWDILAALGEPLGSHGAVLGRLDAILGHIGAIVSRLGAILGSLNAPRTDLETSWNYLGPSGTD